MYNLISSELFSKLSTTNDEADQPYKVNHYHSQTSMMFIIHVSSSIRHVQKPRVVNHSIYGYTVDCRVTGAHLCRQPSQWDGNSLCIGME